MRRLIGGAPFRGGSLTFLGELHTIPSVRVERVIPTVNQRGEKGDSFRFRVGTTTLDPERAPT
jgi:hypothetical protein